MHFLVSRERFLASALAGICFFLAVPLGLSVAAQTASAPASASTGDSSHSRFADSSSLSRIADNSSDGRRLQSLGAYDVAPTTSVATVSHSVFLDRRPLTGAMPFAGFSMAEPYTGLAGITTFRGGPRRDSPAFGTTRMTSGVLEIAWRYRTGASKWGGGAAWTGQPLVVRWPDGLRGVMNLSEPFRGRAGFTEVIQASASGYVYFLDLATGKPSRPAIAVGNPIKGTPALDPRGIPVLYVGQGIKENGPMGLTAFSLLDGSRLWHHPGIDPVAPKGWDAMDGSPLVDSGTDTLIQTAENGLLYFFRLNTEWQPGPGARLSQKPEAVKYRYTAKLARRGGIENSVAVDRNLAWFADNGGAVQCVDIRTLAPQWVSYLRDDTDASVVVDREKGRDGAVEPIVYAGSEVDLQGTTGLSLVRRIHGLTGVVEWEREFFCRSILGERPVNGGMLATPALGKGLLDDLIFLTIARYRTLNAGLVIALDKRTGKTIWERTFANYSWSSPVVFYGKDGTGFLLQGDSGGELHLLEGSSGETLSRVRLGGIVEASPVFFEDMVVVGTRNNEVLGIRVR